MDIKVLAIRTDFGHHGDQFGYKQLLKFTHPYKVIGINERNEKDPDSWLKRKYPWLFEFTALKYKREVDLVHILYGEDYYRWTSRLFKNIPVVVTFHQPAETLEREVLKGDVRGRVGSITHRLSKNRFKQLAAAIVTNPSQIAVLEKVMPREKIHYIPLGLHLEDLNSKFSLEPKKVRIAGSSIKVLTVGNWMRDWEFYFKVVEACPDIEFHLVDRKISKVVHDRTGFYSNLHYHSDLSDDAMFDLYLTADLQFLPVSGIAGSNAFLQGLALGCPTLITDLNSDYPVEEKEVVFYYKKGDVEACIQQINEIGHLSAEKRRRLQQSANAYANQFSWKEIAQKTYNLYKKVI